ncbi:unnamed protein product, partial [Ectocarpus sp. 12 AP-2014]
MGVLAGLVKLCLCGTFLLSGVCKLTPKWGADVYAAMDEAFENRFTPFWQEMFFLSEIGVELNAAAVKLIFGSSRASAVTHSRSPPPPAEFPGSPAVVTDWRAGGLPWTSVPVTGCVSDGSTEVLCAALLFTSHKLSAAIMLFGLM